MEEWKVERMEGLMEGRMEGCKVGMIDRWKDGIVEGWEGWMNEPDELKPRGINP